MPTKLLNGYPVTLNKIALHVQITSQYFSGGEMNMIYMYEAVVGSSDLTFKSVVYVVKICNFNEIIPYPRSRIITYYAYIDVRFIYLRKLMLLLLLFQCIIHKCTILIAYCFLTI